MIRKFNNLLIRNLKKNCFLKLQRFPYPPYKNAIIELGVYFLSTVIVFSCMINVVYIARTIVIEKEAQMKVCFNNKNLLIN